MKNRIKEIRKTLGMSIKELAINSGLSAGYICHLEKGTRSNPTLNTMQSLAKALNKTVDEIFNQK